MTQHFYDWQKTFSYDAPVTMVIGARGVGKTFGLREQMLRDYLKDGWSHVEICRYSKQVSAVCEGYFDKVRTDTEDPVLRKKLEKVRFRYQGRHAYITLNPEDKKPTWDLILTVVALTNAQELKKQTFTHVRRVVFDEAILERYDRFHRYLPNEYGSFAGLMDTIMRQQPGKGTDVRIYLLGNACDLINPYFAHFGIDEEPRHGYSWHDHKLMLLHYPDAGQYGIRKREETIAGRLAIGTAEEGSSLGNIFSTPAKHFVGKKPKNACLQYVIAYRNERFAVFSSFDNDHMFVTTKVPKNLDGAPTFALTNRDNKPNYLVAKRANKPLNALVELYCLGIVKFDKASTYERFNEIVSLFGVR